jgi:hypothetical protein
MCWEHAKIIVDDPPISASKPQDSRRLDEDSDDERTRMKEWLERMVENSQSRTTRSHGNVQSGEKAETEYCFRSHAEPRGRRLDNKTSRWVAWSWVLATAPHGRSDTLCRQRSWQGSSPLLETLSAVTASDRSDRSWDDLPHPPPRLKVRICCRLARLGVPNGLGSEVVVRPRCCCRNDVDGRLVCRI